MSEKEYAERPNKTQQKREMRALNELGQALCEQPKTVLESLPISDSIIPVLLEAKRLSRGALQRQYRRIASLLKGEDTAAIETALNRHLQPQREDVQLFHQLEQLRDQLLTDQPDVLTGLMDKFPAIDRQRMRQLIRNAQSERQNNKEPRAYRELFKYLRQLHES